MTFPSSVEHLPLPRSKRHSRRSRRDPDGDIVQQSHVNQEQNQATSAEVGLGGPVLDFGRNGGAVLERNKNGWEWTWANENRKDLRYVASEEAVCLFPPTRSVDEPAPRTSPADLIDSSTKYIESLCSPYERYGLREALVSILDPNNSNQAGPSHTSKQPELPSSERNIYDGPKLAIIENPRARIANTLLAFPVGEVEHHLSEATCLLVRLQSTTHLLNLIPDHTYVPPSSQPPILSQRIASLSYSDTEGRRHVDVALDPVIWSRVLVVDESGGVWLWWEEKENRSGRIEKAWNLRKIRSKNTDEKHQFYRIAFGSKPGTALVVSSREAIVIDLDDPQHHTTTLFSLQSGDRYITSLEKTALQRKSPYTTICTNHEVMWIDESKPGRPMLSWKHDYGNLTDLEIGVIPGLTSKDLCTILYSPEQRFMMLFPHSKAGQLKSLFHPYALTLPVKDLGSILTFSPRSLRHSTSFIGLAPDGGVYVVSLISAQPFNGRRRNMKWDKAISNIRAQWDENVTKLSERGKADGTFSKGRELDLRWAWIEINQPARIIEEQAYFHPEQFEQYLRELDAPFEHLMTAADLAREAVYPEPTNLHSHLLTPLSIHPRAPTATLDDLTNLDVAKHLPVITELSEDLPAFQQARPPLLTPSNQAHLQTEGQREEDPNAPSYLFEHLRQSFPNTKKEDIAQLSLDLSLSRTIISSEPLSLPHDASEDRPNTGLNINSPDPDPDDLFARAAGLSLKDPDHTPPEIQFAFLPPKSNFEGYDDLNNPDGVPGRNVEPEAGKYDDDLQNLTMRGLLADWKVGEDPTQYQWTSWRIDEKDHRGSSAQSQSQPQSQPQSQKPRIIKPLPSPLRQSQPQSHTQQAFPHQAPHNQLKSSSSLTNLFERSLPPTLARSSPPPMVMDFALGPGPGAGSSQPEESAWAATQIERGPYGGREKERDKEKKKKKDKKRVGGF
uniref:Uncharacterized protein n=1 Tax=Kwoniella dejecticola CBS 10117 TaxID=1296121 RepID=A0A1A6AEL2_9TREE|nr:uncharacterized protein I303_00328 [Kwoniella dejecticola CBS 10117]OBR88511.1 hypothetical protein I303_00328 [Kwoniella dejecticola CBS 10117]